MFQLEVSHDLETLLADETRWNSMARGRSVPREFLARSLVEALR